ncbi:MAG: nicotinate phosphoribosyltransferase [Puniceicoccaceae bacterium 5H]|nr:MAG: nicotinate phosphoribosyltransferase [Puniceicoccaceae bacterium 5H]
MIDLAHGLGLYTDRYELAMARSYWHDGMADKPAVYDYFFRTLPFGGGYAVFAGLGTLLELLPQFRYDAEAIEFLRADGFDEAFLHYLRQFRFRGSLWAPTEGEPVFPLEPVVRAEGTLLELQLIETLLLNVLNFQTLIATKAARCVQAGQGRVVSEFGLRRAQGLGSLWAARAACIGGCTSTSNVIAAQHYNLPAAGTMAHAFVQAYGDELAAFRAFAEIHGSSTVLLLDTFDTVRSGLPNAITVAQEMRARGQQLAGVRLDSGDLAYLSRKVRRGLDAAGLPEVQIVASNQLDEYLIRSLILQDAPIDIFGVGTALATGASDGALDGVYKLSTIDGEPRVKLSETLAKSTLPGRKNVIRYTDEAQELAADAVVLADETAPERMIHPFEPHRQLPLAPYGGDGLLQPVMQHGEPLAEPAPIRTLADQTHRRLAQLPPEHRRFENPHPYKVGLSPQLRALWEDQRNCEKAKVG